MNKPLEREQRILDRLTIKTKKAFHAAQAALEHWLSYNPKVICQTKDQELHDSWYRKNEIYKRVLIQRDACAERVEELREDE